jgi:hypothetical protein
MVLCAVLAIVVWAPLGRFILAALGARDLGFSCAIALGTGAWGFIVLLLGLAGWLWPGVLAGAAAILALMLRADYLSFPFPWKLRPVRDALPGAIVLRAALGTVGLFCLGLAALASLAPETSFDALNVHLPYARDAAREHRLAFARNNWSSAMPALPLMSYVTAFVLSGVELAKLCNFVAYLAAGGIVYRFARREGELCGLAAATLFWSAPIALYEATTALIDLPLALYSALAVLALLEWTRTGDRPLVAVSAVGLGLALGCKYHALFWLAPAVVILFCHARWVERRTWRETGGLSLLYLGIVAALAAPWLVRAWVYTGNPVFPVANAWFRSPYFTPAMEAAARAAYANEGIGTSWEALLRLPWQVAFHPGPFRGTVGPVFFVGTLAAAAAALVRRDRTLGYALLLAGAYFVAWGRTAQEIRYLLPIVPLLAAATAMALVGGRPEAGAAAGLRRVAAWAGGIAIVAAGVANLPSFYPLWVKEWTYWHSFQSPLEYLAGQQSAEDYLRRDVPSIEVYNWMNGQLGPSDRVLLLNDAAQFYARVPTLYSFTVDGETVLLQESEAGVLGRLKELGITHVLLNYNGLAPLPGVAPRQGVYFFLDGEFRRRHLEPLCSRNNVVLYRVRG